MVAVTRIFAVLFFVLAALAAFDAINHLLGFAMARRNGQEVPREQFEVLVRNLAFTWVFVAIYLGIGLGFWQRRRLQIVIIFLFVPIVGLWMNVGYITGFVAAFVALGALALPRLRATFRN